MFAVSGALDGGNHPVYVATIGKTNLLSAGSAVNTRTLTVPMHTVVEPGDTIELSGADVDGVDNDANGTMDAADPGEAAIRERWTVTNVGPIVGGNRTITLAAANADNVDNDRDGTRDSGPETATPNRGLFNAWGAGATVDAKPGSASVRLSGMYRSADNGANWNPMPLAGSTEAAGFFGIHPGAQGRNHFSMVADPTLANVVYVGGDRQPLVPTPSLNANDFNGRLFRGDASIANPANVWTPITHNGTANGSAPHADSRHLVFRGLHLVEVDASGSR
jgi:hypothetical protein